MNSIHENPIAIAAPVLHNIQISDAKSSGSRKAWSSGRAGINRSRAILGNSTGIQSVENAGEIVKALVISAGPASTEISRKFGCPSATPGVRIALVEQTAETFRYGLGPLALQLGLAYLDRLNVVRFANQTEQVCSEEVCGASGWFNQQMDQGSERILQSVIVGVIP